MPTKSAPTADNAAATAAGLREQVLAGIRQSQQLTLDAAKGWVELVGKAVPSAAMPASVPGAPTAADLQEAVSASFGLVHELVSAQEAFVEQLFSTILPATAPSATTSP
jgi:hypothetical protein